MEKSKGVIVDTSGQVINYNAGAASINSGGIYNPVTGLGGSGDKGDNAYFTPTYLNNRSILENVYAQSWVAAKFIDIPIDDMLIRWREWHDNDDTAIDAVTLAEQQINCATMLSMAMKAGRLHGTGLAVLITKEASLDEPLELQRIKEGDLSAVQAFDRFSATIEEWVTDIHSPDYGRPWIYRITTKMADAADLLVHHSRVLRFDGRRSVSSEGWRGHYDRDWGISELIPAIREITYDASLVAGISHLTAEASIPVVKTEGFKEALATGHTSPDEATISQLGTALNTNKSMFKTMFLDVNDEFDRVAVSFAGLPELMDKFAMRMAAIAGIPATRFLSQSPAGMNATGDSDMRNYAMHVAALQKRLLTVPLTVLDQVIARHVGLAKPLKYQWLNLIDVSEDDQAKIAKARIDGLVIAVRNGLIDENEARATMSAWGDSVLGSYEGDIDVLVEPEPAAES